MHAHAQTHTGNVKVWVLADSQNGYFHTLQVYTGREGSEEKKLGQSGEEPDTSSQGQKSPYVY